MISPLAITLALAFWAPYGPTCQPTLLPYASDPNPTDASAQVGTFAYTRLGYDCSQPIYYNPRLPQMGIPAQCTIIAHEIGHREFNLQHSSDPNNIMFPSPSIPGACNVKTHQSKLDRSAHQRHH